jgi:menaquinone-specific isochorismate synthase
MSPENKLPALNEARDKMRSLIRACKPSKSVERIEIKIRPVDMLSWLALQKNDVKIYGANQSDTMAIAGVGQAACVTGKKLVSYKDVFRKLRSFLTPQYPYLQWYGGFCFDQRRGDEEWKEFGAYRFVLPRFELAAQNGKMIFCCNLRGKEDIPGILWQLDEIKIKVTVPETGTAPKAGQSPLMRQDNPDFRRWEKNVGRILSDNAVKKVVLARKTLLNFKQVPDPWGMLRRLKAVTPNSYHFAFQFKGTCFLGASPERLFRRHQRGIESEALAGTMPKSKGPASLKDSPKDRREHALVVNAIDGSFKRFCRAYERDSGPDILTLPNGHHLITKFRGQLKDGIKDEDVLKSLHPTPALGGTPRGKAMDAIRKLEGFSRGWYGAPIGYAGLDWAEFVVGIRSGLVRGKTLSVFAGAGIVDGSDALGEWEEVENKISSFLKIIR